MLNVAKIYFIELHGEKRNVISFGNVTIHLQVAVPPSPKALIWFCCQLESSGVFPQFFYL